MFVFSGVTRAGDMSKQTWTETIKMDLVVLI